MRTLTGAVVMFNLALAVVAGVGTLQLQRTSEDTAARWVADTAKQIEREIEQTLGVTDLVLQNVVDQHLIYKSQTPRVKGEALARLAARHPWLNVLLTTTAEGEVQYWPPRPPGAGVSLADRAYFVRLRDDPEAALQVSPPVISRTTGLPVLALARRLSDAQGQFDGATVASIPVRHFVAGFESKLQHPSDTLELFDAQGHLIVSMSAAGVELPDPTGTANAPLRSAAQPPSDARLMRSEVRNPTYGYSVALAIAPHERFGGWKPETLALLGGWMAFGLGSLVWLSQALVERRRQAQDERALRESEGRFRSFFDHAMIGMAVLSPTREWLQVNPALASILGRTAAEVMATPLTGLVDAQSAEQLELKLAKVFSGEQDGATMEARLVHPQLGSFEAQLSLRGFDGGENLRFMALCVQDISQHKHSERRAASALAVTQHFIDHFPGAAFLKDENLRVVLANRGFKDMLGLEPGELIGRTNEEIFPGEFGAKLSRDDRRVLESSKSEVVEEVLGNRYFETHKFRVTGSDGRLMLGGLTVDVTLRHQIAARVRVMLELNGLGSQFGEREFVSKALEAVEKLTYSHIGFLHYINDDQETIELVTWTQGALKGCQAAHDTHYPISKAGIWADAFRTRSAVVFNDYPGYAAKRGLPDGHAHLLRLVCVPVMEGDKVRMLLGVGNRKTEYDDFAVTSLQLLGNDIWRNVRRLRAEAALRLRVDELNALNQQLTVAQNQLLQSEKMASIGQLAAGVAHELNNPISFVHSNLATLTEYVTDLLHLLDLSQSCAQQHLTAEQSQPLDQAWRERDINYIRSDIVQLLAESREGANRVRVIVKNLKDLAHVSDDELVWSDLRDGLNSTINIVWNELKYKVELVKEYADIPLVLCMPTQINQVFMNLLINAGHAIQTRGVITIRTGVSDREVWVEVEDNGQGIAPEHIHHVFEPFFTTKPVGQGTGLGLSVSHSIVAKHRGQITVRSELGVGTCFRLSLPLITTEVPADTERLDAVPT
ncbi:ATP-binding protein [Ideonella sp. A 288]|uniref:ATP-binding protein n=1 Tax=Ideonella sp. A 288 TaxID=1962181 RepID=UPI001303568E|nr:ATP-binding protein [Ideonella sp. A 288]